MSQRSLTNLDLYNTESARIQTAVGQNPMECLRVASTGSPKPVKWAPFLDGFAHMTWMTPESGERREHDESFHLETIRYTPAELALFGAEKAWVGLMLAQRGDEKTAKDVVARKLDLLFSRASLTWGVSLMSLMNVVAHPEARLTAAEVKHAADDMLDRRRDYATNAYQVGATILAR